RLYTRRDELGEGELPVPLKLVHINRCPVLAPLKVLREEDRQRLCLDLGACERHAEILRDSQPQWQAKLGEVFAAEAFAPLADPEQQLYSGFLGERDRRLCEQVRQSAPAQLARDVWAFADERLPELLFRYRARNFPETLTDAEVQRWRAFCAARLQQQELGAPNTLDSFEAAMREQWELAGETQRQVLQAWSEYAQNLRGQYAG